MPQDPARPPLKFKWQILIVVLVIAFFALWKFFEYRNRVLEAEDAPYRESVD